MVKLTASKGKSGDSYALMFGNAEMGRLLSRVQASIIRGGFELEDVIWNFVPEVCRTTLDDLNDITQYPNDKPNIQVVRKPSRPDPDDPKKSIQADFLIVDNKIRQFMLVEVKEGYVFDTKKSDGELSSLKSITSWLAQEFAYRTHYYFCSFNQEDKDVIVAGTKKRFSNQHVMTGREFCERIGIDYDGIRDVRKRDQSENRQYFLEELLSIPEIREEIVSLLKLHGDTNE